ncbi:MAG: Fic family protein [Candidatus Peregrinibacteria bacterium]|nr:Fic family protein [Candidatus Peregrinibacteria bacterium]
MEKRRMYPPLLAIEFYIRFESIHPFIDGNGRTGRILFDAILFHTDYMPIVFFTENHASHCKAITKAVEGRYGNFQKHFLEQAEKTIKLIKLHE